MTNTSVITIFADSLAFIAMLAVLILSLSNRKKESGRVLLRMMIICIMIDAACNGVAFAMRGQTFEGAAAIAMISQTILELALVSILYLWLLFVDFQLYGSRDHLKRHYRLFFLPVIVFFILILANPVTGILFTQKVDNGFMRTTLYNVMLVIEYSYTLVSVWLVVRYRKENGKLKFFRAAPMLLPIACSILVSELTDYSFVSLGFAAGMLNIYLFMRMHGKYEDEQEGFYNASYLSQVKEWEEKGHRDKGVLIRFMCEGNIAALAKILREELPRDAEILHIGEGRYLMMASGKNKSFFDLVIKMVQEATDEFNRENPKDRIKLNVDIINQEEL